MSPYTHFRVQFLLHWFAYLYSTLQFLLQSDTCIQKQSLLQNLRTCIPPQPPLQSFNTCILASSIVITHIYFYPQIKKIIIIIFKKKTKKPQYWQKMRLERNYYFSLPYPPFYFSLPALWLLLSLLHLFSPASAFLSPYSLVLPCSFSQTSATTITRHQSPGPLCQPASPMPPRSSRCLFSIPSTHSDPPTSLRSLLFTLHPSVALLSSLLTSGPFLPWLLLMPCLHQRAYR